ncbi:uncharacterized protein LOC113276352 [Papaver somniferum]|uniref:uncharacterized protein LOC113276352 n=1 Tax=Papaver somniferum TaxID=3469 RepID=UPI000E701DCB|nr:uncharacterized protein LOC113276352 [Papaver somniferum]
MEEVEKMEALKKAYADIILNTAKEAATRIMIAERKAIGFQQQVFSAKDEALNMLLRLKQMSDSKVAQIETESVNQRKRIKELEAQLNEAKAVERDLRVELKGAQVALEEVKNKSMQPASELPVSPGTSNAVMNLENTGDNCCSIREDSTEPTAQVTRDLELFDDNTDLASLIMRSKKPELYKNGCTQRIRAFERKLKKRNVSTPGLADPQFTDPIKEDGAVDGNCGVATPMNENMGFNEKKLTKSNGQVNNFLRRSCRKRRSKYSVIEVISNKYKKSREASSKIARCSNPNGMVELGKGLPKMIGERGKRKSKSPLFAVSSLTSTSIISSSECEDGTENKPCEVLVAVKDRELTDASLVSYNVVEESSRVSDCEQPMEVGVSLMDSNFNDAKKCELTKSTDDKLLKYTFTRKRKKESLTSPDKGASSVEMKNTTKRRSGENQNSDPEPQKPLNDSSRDSRRLAQVARQLISLSEKRW